MAAQLDVEVEALKKQIAELVNALDRIMEYASIGASVTDVNTREQPQFIEARRLLALHGRARP